MAASKLLAVRLATKVGQGKASPVTGVPPPPTAGRGAAAQGLLAADGGLEGDLSRRLGDLLPTENTLPFAAWAGAEALTDVPIVRYPLASPPLLSSYPPVPCLDTPLRLRTPWAH